MSVYQAMVPSVLFISVLLGIFVAPKSTNTTIIHTAPRERFGVRTTSSVSTFSNMTRALNKSSSLISQRDYTSKYDKHKDTIFIKLFRFKRDQGNKAIGDNNKDSAISGRNYAVTTMLELGTTTSLLNNLSKDPRTENHIAVISAHTEAYNAQIHSKESSLENSSKNLVVSSTITEDTAIPSNTTQDFTMSLTINQGTTTSTTTENITMSSPTAKGTTTLATTNEDTNMSSTIVKGTTILNSTVDIMSSTVDTIVLATITNNSTLSPTILTEGSTMPLTITVDTTMLPNITENSTGSLTIAEDITMLLNITENSTRSMTITEDITMLPHITEDSTGTSTITEDTMLPNISEDSTGSLTITEDITMLPSITDVSPGSLTITEDTTMLPTVTEDPTMPSTISEDTTLSTVTDVSTLSFTITDYSSVSTTIAENTTEPASTSEETFSGNTSDEVTIETSTEGVTTESTVSTLFTITDYSSVSTTIAENTTEQASTSEETTSGNTSDEVTIETSTEGVTTESTTELVTIENTTAVNNSTTTSQETTLTDETTLDLTTDINVTNGTHVPTTETPSGGTESPEPDKDVSVKVVAGILGVLLLGGLVATGAVMYRQGKLPWKARNSHGSVRPHPIHLSRFEHQCSQLLETPARLGSEFQLLQTLSEDVVDTNTFVAAQLPDNKKKNRYINILPYDLTRVKLEVTNDDPSDYINASYIKGYSNMVEYIASQGPKEETLDDFWRMMHQQNVRVIAMVANFEEAGKRKCEPYFPKFRDQMLVGDSIITCSTELHFPMYTQRTIVLHKDDKKRTITHLHFSEWPDFGCPDGTESMLQFCGTLRHHITRNTPGLALVHCSAGVGRTGTLIALDILLQHIQENKKVDIFGTVYKLRKQRTNMVQTEGQYAYIYKCIKDALQDSTILKQENSPTNSLEPIYENVPTKLTTFLYEKLPETKGKLNSSESECEL